MTNTSNGYHCRPLVWFSLQTLLDHLLKRLGVVLLVVLSIEVTAGLQSWRGIFQRQHQHLAGGAEKVVK